MTTIEENRITLEIQDMFSIYDWQGLAKMLVHLHTSAGLIEDDPLTKEEQYYYWKLMEALIDFRIS